MGSRVRALDYAMIIKKENIGAPSLAVIPSAARNPSPPLCHFATPCHFVTFFAARKHESRIKVERYDSAHAGA